MADAAKPYPPDPATHADVLQVLASVAALSAKVDRVNSKLDGVKEDLNLLRIDTKGVQVNLQWMLGIGGAIGTMMLAVIGGVLLRIVLSQ